MTQERRLTVLRAIVEEYVETSEPVGSKAISQRHQLGVSPATIRNDMAALEDEGLIVQPHTSAGRVPTDLGYRLFVDKLAQVRPLSGAERRAVSTLLDGAVDLEDMVARSVRALAALTHQVAIVQYPSVARSALRHLELLALENGRVMAVLIMENGRVEQRVITLPPIGEASGDTAPGLRFVSQTSLAHLRDRVNQLATGQLVSQLVGELGALVQEFTPLERPGISTIIDSLAEGLGEGAPERLVMAGASHLATHPVDFSNTIQPVLQAIEEQVVLLKLLNEMADDQKEVSVRIGQEHSHEGLKETSMVAAGYGPEGTVARLGVLGPTRMDYPASIAAVRALARYLSRILTTNTP